LGKGLCAAFGFPLAKDRRSDFHGKAFDTADEITGFPETELGTHHLIIATFNASFRTGQEASA
jgi:hypothetical protein